MLKTPDEEVNQEELCAASREIISRSEGCPVSQCQLELAPA